MASAMGSELSAVLHHLLVRTAVLEVELAGNPRSHTPAVCRELDGFKQDAGDLSRAEIDDGALHAPTRGNKTHRHRPCQLAGDRDEDK